MWQRPTVAQGSRRALLVASVLALVLASGFAPLRPPVPVSAGTAETMEATILSLINADRVRVGLVPLRLHAALVDIAGTRAANLAAKGVLSHTAAGCLACQLDARHVQRYASGDVLGGTGYAWGDPAVTSLYGAWKKSSLHWGLLMSKTYNYVGIGVAYRSANRNTYASIVLTESIDQTRPWARMTSAVVKGTTATWAWTGADTALQTHTSGLKDFDVQYRIDSGTWMTVKLGTTTGSLTAPDRIRGHWYGLRVRSRDNRGLLSDWTPEMRVWVP